ncbi:phage/plasmid primase, P4 family [Aurantimonas sp. 22II-16-19i]|uniref:phage/plasmid primase, P4 family n=1 Tax=Aurantimonas sp. 22II-16-19i TaxID=1317114 RepID=UPI0009F7C792|nr:phage/plasmid primase, P4 family [Aurantimonas sp. 22II-16-19i]ORE90982.1 phage/plasmid primase, P4 family protein [Aurantimonas sp. 22II-16-19i]
MGGGHDQREAVLAYLARAGLTADGAPFEARPGGRAPQDEGSAKAPSPSFDARFDPATSSPAQEDDDGPALSPEEILEECRLEPETDIGNGRRLLIRYGDRICHVARVAWHGYDGRRWKEDEDGSIVRPLAQKAAEMIVEEAYGLDGSEEEQAAIVAGKAAREELKALGKAVAARQRAEGQPTSQEARWLARLAIVAAQGEAARETAKRLSFERKARVSTDGEEPALSPEEIRREAARIDAALAEHAGAGARAAKAAKDLDAAIKARKSAEWTAEEAGQAEALKDRIAAMEEAKEAISGRMSSRFRHAKSAAGTTKINNMLTEAAPHCARLVGDLNRDRLALNCANGTLRFVQREDEESDPDDPRFVWTLERHPHRQADYITKLVPFDSPPLSSSPSASSLAGPDGSWQARAPHFDKFLKTVQPDPEMRAFLKRFFGYCLTGLTSEQCLVFFYGIGRNGKSTLTDLLSHVLDDYAVTLSIDSFAGDSRRGGAEATPDLARLPGARVVFAAEPEMGVKLKDALIKQLTGGEKMPVRRLHQDFFEVDPHFKIVLSGNHKPRIDDTSDGIWRRVHMVPFEVQIPKEAVDRALAGKLKREAEGVLAWALEGALEYLNYGLNPPAKVLAATQDYREESDPIGGFIRAACLVSGAEADMVTPGELFDAYSRWAVREGAAEFKQATFSKRFPDYAQKSWEGSDGKMHVFWKAKVSTTVYKGLVIRSEFQPQASGGPGDYPADYGGGR